MKTAASQTKEAGSSVEAGSISLFPFLIFYSLIHGAGPQLQSSLLQDSAGKDTVVKQGTETRMNKNNLSSPALSLLWEYLGHPQTAILLQKDWQLCLEKMDPFAFCTQYCTYKIQPSSCLQSCPNLPPSITHTETEEYAWILKMWGIISWLLSVAWESEMQTLTDCSQKGNALNPSIPKWQYFCQRSTHNTHLASCPRETVVAKPHTTPAGLEEGTPRAAFPSHWSRWGTHSSPASVSTNWTAYRNSNLK